MLQDNRSEVSRSSLIYIWILGFALFFPGMISRFGLMLEQALTVALMGIASVVILLNRKPAPSAPLLSSLFCFAYFQFAILFSLYRSVELATLNDYYEIFKPLYLYTFFLLPFFALQKIRDFEIVSRFLVAFCLVLSVYAIWEAWSDTGHAFSIRFYKPSREVLVGKAVGPFIITYAFASFLMLPFFYFLTRFLSERSLFNKHLLCLMIVFAAVLSTQSRTVIIALGVATACYGVLHLIYPFTVYKMRALCALMLFVSVAIGSLWLFWDSINTEFAYLFNGLAVLWDSLREGGLQAAVGSSPSTSLRVEQLLFVLNTMDIVPLFGVAIGKATLMPESIYTLYLYRVGTLGLVLHLFFVVYLILKSYKCAKEFSGEKPHLYAFFMAIHFYAITLPVSYLSSAINDQTRTGFVFYFLLAVTILVLHELKKKSKYACISNNAVL